MCGIAGILHLKGIDPEPVARKMLLALQQRGRDATGMGAIVDGEFIVAKLPKQASEFIKSDPYKHFWSKHPKPPIILHTRAATSGSPKNNENNHPLLSKKGLILTHNGIITNSKDLTKTLKLDVDGECDSEVVLRLIEQLFETSYPKAIAESVELTSGSWACSLLTKLGYVYLWRNSMPIVVGYVPKIEALVYASTKQIINAGFGKTKEYLGFFRNLHTPKIIFQELEDELIRIKGQKIEKFKLPEPKKVVWVGQGKQYDFYSQFDDEVIEDLEREYDTSRIITPKTNWSDLKGGK